MTRATLIIADDHALVIEGIRRILSREFDVVGLASNGVELVKLVVEHEPDLVVADISMPEMNGLEALASIRLRSPETRVVMLTMHRDEAYAASAKEAGASGYVLKHSDPSELIDTLHAAMDGGARVSPEMAERSSSVDLTTRQRGILTLLVRGLTTKEVAARVGISSRTVEYHKYRLQSMFGVGTTAELIRVAIERGLVS